MKFPMFGDIKFQILYSPSSTRRMSSARSMSKSPILPKMSASSMVPKTYCISSRQPDKSHQMRLCFATMEDYNAQVPAAKNRSSCHILSSFPTAPLCSEIRKFVRLNAPHIPTYLVEKTGEMFGEKENKRVSSFCSRF